MRFDLRLHGRTADGVECRADISVYAGSQQQLVDEAMKAATTAAWHHLDPKQEWVTEGAHITVEHVETLSKKKDSPDKRP